MRLRLFVLFTVVLMAASAFAGDTSSLRPPKGSRVAIIAFEDLQCPDCAAAEPTLKQAQEETKVPLVRHDFPLPRHNWSFEAHVIARYFDTKSPELGEAYRHWVFTNQPSITRANLRGMSQRFAEDHKVELPENVDPKGVLAEKVKNDFLLGQKVGITHTPTIFVVSDSTLGQPFVEVVDRTRLVQMVNDMKAQAAKQRPVGSKKKAVSKKK